MQSENLKTSRSQIVPLVANHYPVSASPTKEARQQDASTISFIAKSMSMVPVPTPTDEEDNSRIMEITDYELEERLEPLAKEDMIILRQISEDIEKFINVPNKYQVENSSGDKLYGITETTSGLTRRLFRKEQPFSMQLLNNEGKCVLEFDGDPGVGGLKAFVKMQRKTSTLGKVVQANPCLACCNFSPTYNVYNEKGIKVAKIRWVTTQLKTCMMSAEFQMLSTAGAAAASKKHKVMATISRKAKKMCMTSNNRGDTYSINYEDCRMEPTDKALLIAAAIMLDFQFFEGREGCHLWKLFVCCFILVLVVLVVAGVAAYFITEHVNKS